MVESADTGDLKSPASQGACGFKSRRRHVNRELGSFTIAVNYNTRRELFQKGKLMGKRRDRFDRRASNQKIARGVNGPIKAKERARRAVRIKNILRTTRPPYPRHVTSWLCAELGKKSDKITPADVAAVLKDSAGS